MFNEDKDKTASLRNYEAAGFLILIADNFSNESKKLKK